MRERDELYHIVVVDDDIVNLKTAGNILSEHGMRVTAFSGGQAMLDYIAAGNRPDLILLDVLMRGIDGFETLRLLRKYEKENRTQEIPVIYLTADEDKEAEAKGLEEGALDYIRKPFDPDALIRRIRNILGNVRKMQELAEEASTDSLTGLLNRESVSKALESVCRTGRGTLFVIDLDSFKLVNDLYGHEAGDKILISFAQLLQNHFRSRDIVGRIGGDEFVAFLKESDNKDDAVGIIHRLNEQLNVSAYRILGQDMTIPLGVSAGAVITGGGDRYEDLFNKADKCLLHVKQNGKHDCTVWEESGETPGFGEDQTDDLKRMNMILGERNVDRHALWLGQEAFGNIYRYMLRYIGRYQERAYKVLFTITPESENSVHDEAFVLLIEQLGEILRGVLRNSDIMMQSLPNQFFLLLPMVTEADIQKVIKRILTAWRRLVDVDKAKISYETEAITPEKTYPKLKGENEVPWVIVVDDDVTTLKQTGQILSENGMRVTALNNGKALIDCLEEEDQPDLVLLDVLMADMDGFETLAMIREAERGGEMIPVVYLTSVENDEAEEKGLLLGAMDYIKKPVSKEVLALRVKRAIRNARLQKKALSEENKKA